MHIYLGNANAYYRDKKATPTSTQFGHLFSKLVTKLGRKEGKANISVKKELQTPIGDWAKCYAAKNALCY